MTLDTTTPAQAATPEAQVADGKQTTATVPEQPHTEPEATATTWTLDAALAEMKKARDEAAKYRKEKQAEVKARETAEAAALAEQGKFKELYEKVAPKLNEYDTLKAAYDAMIAQTQAANERRIAAIPEQMRSLVPEYDDPQRLAAWLDANAAVFAKPVAPSLDGRAGGNGGVQLDEAAIKAQAVRLGLDPEVYFRQAQQSAVRR